MGLLKKNPELYSQIKQTLQDRHKLRFSGLFGLPKKALDSIESLELNNISSGEGLEQLSNLKEFKLIANKSDIDIDSYINSIKKLPNLNKLNLNVPNARYLSKEQIKSFGDLKNVKPKINISTISWSAESYSAEEMLQVNEKMDDFKRFVNPLMSQQEKAERLYRELGNYISFDDGMGNRLRDGNLAGALIDGRVICQGYSRAVEEVFNDNGIECITVGGQGGNPGDMGNHAWNQAKVNGEWYNLDLTFDSASNKDRFNRGDWENFLKSDDEFGKSHIRDEGEGHPCTNAKFDNANKQADANKKQISLQRKFAGLGNTRGRF